MTSGARAPSQLVKAAMFRLLSRFVALVLAAIAFAALVVDATRSFSAGTLIVTPLGLAAAKVAPAKALSVREMLEKYAPAYLFDVVSATVPRLPVWLALGVAAFLLFRLSRDAPPKFGYSSR